MADDTQVTRSTPPLLERVASMRFQPLPTDVFNQKADEWQTRIAAEYGEREAQQEWKLNIPEKNGVPDFSALQPELILHRRFWKGAGGSRAIAMQCRNGWLSFNIVNREGSRHRYAELRDEVSQYLPSWAAHFGVQHFNEFSLLYVNRLSRHMTPQFFDTESGSETLHVGRALTAFGQVLPYKGTLIPPYNYTLNMRLDEPLRGVLTFTVESKDKADRETGRVVVDVKLGMAIKAAKHEAEPAHAVAHLDSCHALLLNAYQHFFTKDALESFQEQ